MQHRMSPSRAARSVRLGIEPLEERSNPSTAYLATDLISDQPGVAAITDPTLVNAWGLSLNGINGAFWVSAADTGLSEVYSTTLGQPFKVAIPGGAPTGQLFANSAGNFMVSGVDVNGDPIAAPAVFIFASETGHVTGWAPTVFPTQPPGPGVSKDAITGFSAADGASYKGIAMADNGDGNFLYLADFHNGKIDVLDSQFHLTQLAGSFTDPNLPAGFAPFNVAAIGGKLYVSYAKQDATAADDVAGKGNGFIDVFDLKGNFETRLVSRGDLNSPWAMVQAPDGFGDFSGALLVGNFGDGKIHAYDPASGKELGTLSESRGHPLVIDGLWGLAFGNRPGDTNTLYYAAGPDDEAHGLFGKITANAAGTSPVTATLTDGTLAINGSRDDDRVSVQTRHDGDTIVVRAGSQVIGTFDASAVQMIQFKGWAGNDIFQVSQDITVPVMADGGAGNDILHAGSGGAILLGNTGNDFLLGGSSRDLLIGGDGRDFLFGRSGDDVLVGGSTAFDANTAALLQILNQTAGAPVLDSSTVTDDGVRDDLFGGPGQDTFFATDPDVVHGGQDS